MGGIERVGIGGVGIGGSGLGGLGSEAGEDDSPKATASAIAKPFSAMVLCITPSQTVTRKGFENVVSETLCGVALHYPPVKRFVACHELRSRLFTDADLSS